MIRKVFVFLMLGGLGSILYKFLLGYKETHALPAVARHYLENGPSEIGAANIVTSVVVTYRGLDTLGEVTILFSAAAVVGLLLSTGGRAEGEKRAASELLKTASTFLTPLIALFGVYIFINGHLTPGGGFQGGAVMALALVLSMLANPNHKVGHKVIAWVEAISGMTYVALGVLGAVLAVGGFLDNRLLPLGEYGALFSAGLIPIIYSLIGLKVGSELSSIVVAMNGGQAKGGTEE
jgi:multicomponent Na+:H+ antiporter subunit B